MITGTCSRSATFGLNFFTNGSQNSLIVVAEASSVMSYRITTALALFTWLLTFGSSSVMLPGESIRIVE